METQVQVQKPVVKIRNWHFHKSDHTDSEYMIGTIGKGHPRLASGTEVRTSGILKKDKGVVETRNTIYVLDHSVEEE
jgi:hypothetical protein